LEGSASLLGGQTMTDGDRDEERKRTLQLTLGGITVAGAISVIMGEGEWTWWAPPLGVTLILLLHAFDVPELNDSSINLAFGAIWSLCALVTIGYLLDYIDEHLFPYGAQDGLFAVTFWIIATALWTYFGSEWRKRVPERMRNLPRHAARRKRRPAAPP
jgi:hypothetical protein